jgi:hypothetical protein
MALPKGAKGRSVDERGLRDCHAGKARYFRAPCVKISTQPVAVPPQSLLFVAWRIMAEEDWRVFLSRFFAGSVGGSGAVFGADGDQSVTVLDQPGMITFDPSFNRGGDCVTLPGDAGDWTVSRAGSNAVFSDGDTIVTIPVGTAGMAVLFDDGARTLAYSADAGAITIGAQAVSYTAAPITAVSDNPKLPAATMGGSARLFLAEGGEAAVAGRFDIFGTASAEKVTVQSGEIVFDPSFNRGDDVIVLAEPIENFQIALSGSSALLASEEVDLTIPVGLTETWLRFTGAVVCELYYDAAAGNALIGGHVIGPEFEPIVSIA